MKEQKSILSNSEITDSICEPEKGWYSEKDVACRKCNECMRKICQVFSVENGFKVPENILRIPKGSA